MKMSDADMGELAEALKMRVVVVVKERKKRKDGGEKRDKLGRLYSKAG